jgi:hypothetical protein
MLMLCEATKRNWRRRIVSRLWRTLSRFLSLPKERRVPFDRLRVRHSLRHVYDRLEHPTG